ncbi:hypothetical protein EGM51_08340 [Verrucomicrobia bacterium S94]|nr:hypothetical protein EGM51_08340 [Verrucomicrobia bacterium S94]
MRKIRVILGLVLSAGLIEGVVFFVSSRIPENVDVPELEEVSDSTFDEILAGAVRYRELRRFGVARELVRQALDRAGTPEEQALAGYQMGGLLFEDYLGGGETRPGAAVLYLEAAFEASAPGSELQTEIGFKLLDVLEATGDKKLFLHYLETMTDTAEKSEFIIRLWDRKFDYLVNSDKGWRELTKTLAAAEAMPLQDAAWAELLEDVRLRARERVLADDSWLEAFKLIEGEKGLTDYRMRVFSDVQKKLEQKIENGGEQEQEEGLLRLAGAMVSVEKYEEAENCLKRFLEREPTEHLIEAFTVLERIFRGRGNVAFLPEFAELLIRQFDFNAHSEDEILGIVELLEENDLDEDALRLLRGCFSFREFTGGDSGKLIARAAVLEERTGDHDRALDYMHQLQQSDADDALALALSELTDLNMDEGDYEAVENWVYLFSGRLPQVSEAYGDALFSLFEAKYWLDRPVLEQLFVGSAAIQHMPEDPRVGSVELRMARYIEEMKLHDLAVSYYNRIGLLNFFQGNSSDTPSSENISEQAMLGKARCLKQLEDWEAADHLFRELCNRTASPLVKSEAAVQWAELAMHFGQNREAARRFDLAHAQMLSPSDKVRYALGRLKLRGDERFHDPSVIEENLALFDNLPDGERRMAVAAYFDEAFDYLHKAEDEPAMLRLIDLAYQSDCAEWVPIQSYVLRVYEDRFRNEALEGLGHTLREKDTVAGASLTELSQVVERLEHLVKTVKKHEEKVWE